MKNIFLAIFIAIIAIGFLSAESFSNVVDQNDILITTKQPDTLWTWLTEALPVFSGVIALVGVLFTAVLTFWAAKRNAYMSLIVAERAKWVNELRDDIAEILSMFSKEFVKTVVHGNAQSSKDDKLKELRPALDDTFIKNAEFLITKISLQLLSETDCLKTKQLNEALNKLPTECVRYPRTEYRAIEKEVVECSRYILHREWSRIDLEVKGSVMSWLTGRSKKYNEKYGVLDI